MFCPEESKSSMELTKLYLRDLVKIAVIAIKLKIPCYFDFFKNERGPESLMMKNKPLRESEWVISMRKAICSGIEKQMEKKKNATVKKIHLPSPSVQKAPRQVPNSHPTKSHQKVPPSPHGKPPLMKRRFQQMHTCQGKNQVDTRSKQVDTRSGQVDTRPGFQQTSLPDWDSRSTLDQGRSTHSD
ncbi:hypothetical protein Taro_049596 [Colocasia esculenta]|uniref:Uncharacterized protein n=1 Tax=Colocasia esculenta TaxID=4460 RepID=A0A843XBA9_COLES|nr:hypothetical protein [Colocasia esculenta]